MNFVRHLVVGLFIFSFLFFWHADSVYAVSSCTLNVTGGEATAGGGILIENGESVQVSASDIIINDSLITGSPDDRAFYINVPEAGSIGKRAYIPVSNFSGSTLNNYTLMNDASGYIFDLGESHTIQLVRDWGPVTPHTVVCSSFTRVTVQGESCSISAQVTRRPGGTFNVGIAANLSALLQTSQYSIFIDTGLSTPYSQTVTPNGNANLNLAWQLPNSDQGRTFEVVARRFSGTFNGGSCTTGCTICRTTIYLDPNAPLTDESPDPDDVLPSTPPVSGGTEAVEFAEFALCDQAATSEDRSKCRACFAGGDDPKLPKKFWTAFGCIEVSKEGIVKDFVRIGLGMSGGFVLLSILYGSFLLTTSSGDPKRVQEGQEMISSAVMGLLFVIFSIVILQFIGVQILKIPGFA